MGIRVHNLARELGLTSKELIERLRGLKIKVKGHMSSLDDDTAILVKEEIGGAAKKTTKKTPAAKKVSAPKRAKKKKTVAAELALPKAPKAAIEPETLPPKEEKPDLKVLKIDWEMIILREFV